MRIDGCDVKARTVFGGIGIVGSRKKTMASCAENLPGFASSAASPSQASQYYPHSSRRNSGENVMKLLAWREVSPTVRRPLRRLWGDAASWSISCSGPRRELTSAKHALITWLEAESLRHCTAKYCPLQPAPRSSIAAAFSPDGSILASTHGDHTVKIICCKTGYCLKTLCGHRRTPWVVRFHPSSSDILASGSLDSEVKLWDANTAECVGSHDFYKPIASIAFHARGDLIAVASGHKLYIWQYSRKGGEAASPAIVLRTRRSLRAVHFHPHAAPLLLTAEVNDLDEPDCPMTLATSPGYLQYTRPAIFVAPMQSSTSKLSDNLPAQNFEPYVPVPTWFWPAAWVNDGDMGSVQSENLTSELNGVFHVPSTTADNLLPRMATDGTEPRGTASETAPMDVSPRPTPVDYGATMVNGAASHLLSNAQDSTFESGVDMLLRAAEGRALASGHGIGSVGGEESDYQQQPQPLIRNDTNDTFLTTASTPPVRQTETGNWLSSGVWRMSMLPNFNMLLGDGTSSQSQHPFPISDQTGWEIPFLQGWVMGQSQAGLVQPILHSSGGAQPGMLVVSTVSPELRGNQIHTPQQPIAGASFVSGTTPAALPASRVSIRARSRGNRSRNAVQTGAVQAGTGTSGGTTIGGGAIGMQAGILHGIASRDPIPGMGVAEAAAAQAAMAVAAAAELPCTVKLRIWPHDIKHPSALLDPETCRLTIPHAVLCSEMGAHFSPCGRFLAACVACVLPSLEPDSTAQNQMALNEVAMPDSSATSPTRHPISAQQVIYELRIYSLEEATFGQVLASRAIRAAHCLTSIQFSPTSGHILLAYGRRHSSLLRSIVVNGTTTIPVFTILEVYRVSDMELVKVLPSADDEVNVACFHPIVGGGLAYGTKEGKLRILQHDRSANVSGSSRLFEDHVFEVG